MAQHDYIISNQTFPNTRADLNNVLQAIATCNKGSSAPSTQYAGQMWIDDSAGTTWTLYLYDGSDNIQVATIDTTANTINFIDSVVTGFDIVTDTTPQLGGTLDTNGNDINFGDNDKAQFGASQDLQIYHDVSGSSIIEEIGGGDLTIRGTNLNLQNSGGTKAYFVGTDSTGAVQLRYGNSPKLDTTSSGIDVTGTVNADGVDLGDSEKIRLGASQDLQIYHDATNSVIDEQGTGQLLVRSNGDGIFFQNGDSTASIANFRVGTSNEFYYNGAKKLETTSSGIDVTGQVLADKAYIAEATLTDGATISWDMSDESVAKVTLGGNRTLNAPTNGSTGQFCSLLVIQDGTGSRTLTWNSTFEFASDTAPTLSTTGGLGDLFVFRYNGTKWLEVGRNLALTLS